MTSKIAIYGLAAMLLASVSFAGIKPSPELEQWMSTGQYFTFQDHQIFYHDSGAKSGTTILMIHGFPTSSWDYRALVTAMSAEHRVVAIDMLGFGFSDKPRWHKYSINEQVELHTALLGHIGVNKVHIIAHDYGGLVAEEMVARFNGNADDVPAIQSLIMLNGPVNMNEIDASLTFSERMAKKVMNGPLGGFASLFAMKFVFDKGFVPVFGEATRPSEQALRDNWFIITRQGGRRLFHKLIHFYDEGLEQGDRWYNAIKDTRVPVLSIMGSADPVVGKLSLERFAELYPNANVAVMDNIGHYPQMEDAETVEKMCRKFLAGLGG